MNLDDRDLIEIEEFKGLLTTPDFRDVPATYSPDCQNVIYSPGGVRSRGGTRTAKDLGIAGTMLHAEFFIYADVRYYLFLVDDSGTEKIYYMTWNPITEAAIAGPTLLVSPTGNPIHFQVEVYGSFVYIFPNDGAYGVS